VAREKIWANLEPSNLEPNNHEPHENIKEGTKENKKDSPLLNILVAFLNIFSFLVYNT
jgi:hypothetical protein